MKIKVRVKVEIKKTNINIKGLGLELSKYPTWSLLYDRSQCDANVKIHTIAFDVQNTF